MKSYVDKYLTNPVTVGMGNPLWIKHIQDHREWLLLNSTQTIISDHINNTERNRPIVVMRKIGIDPENVITVLKINNISLTLGLQEHDKVLMIPTDEAFAHLLETFSAIVR